MNTRFRLDPLVIGDIALIPLQRARRFAIVNASDLRKVDNHWSFSHGYAHRSIKDGDRWVTRYMHRVLMDAPAGQEVDHANGNGLDNRRSNLRFATRLEQQRNLGLARNNTSGFKGVSFSRQRGHFYAYIKIDGRRRYLGRFDSAQDAARAYDAAAREQFGEFARCNFDEVAA